MLESNIKRITMQAATAYGSDTLTGTGGTTGYQRFCKVDSAGLAVRSGSGEMAIGVMEGKPLAGGDSLPVKVDGQMKVMGGGTIAIGARVMSDASGRCVAATGATAFVLGIALTAGVIDKMLVIDAQAPTKFVT